MTSKSKAEKPIPFAERTIVGLVEKVILKHDGQTDELLARIDSGATKSSVDITLASKLKLGPIVESKLIKSANGSKLRPFVKVTAIIAGQEVSDIFSLADRSHMKYKVLIGQNILKRGFLIDPSKE